MEKVGRFGSLGIEASGRFGSLGLGPESMPGAGLQSESMAGCPAVLDSGGLGMRIECARTVRERSLEPAELEAKVGPAARECCCSLEVCFHDWFKLPAGWVSCLKFSYVRGFPAVLCLWRGGLENSSTVTICREGWCGMMAAHAMHTSSNVPLWTPSEYDSVLRTPNGYHVVL